MYYTIPKATKFLGFFIGVIVISLSLSYLVFAWTEPSVNPPNNNVSTPLNIGSTGQSKSGGLILNTGGAPNGLIVQNGNVGIGTPGPGSKLHVTGITQITDGVASADTSAYGTFGVTRPADVNTLSYIAMTRQGNVVKAMGIDSSNRWVFGLPTAGTQIITTPQMVIEQGGNVGIGTTNVVRGVDMRQRVLIRDPAYSGANGWDTADWGGALEIKRPGASSMAAANLWNSQLAISSQGSVSPDTAHISFHRPGIYGANFGLDTDNWFSTQGWSAGAGYTNLRAGTIRSMSGGIQFPDGTTQTSAAGSGGVTTQNAVTVSRALNTVYWNTAGKPMFVTISLNLSKGYNGSWATAQALTDSSNPPSTVIADTHIADDTSSGNDWDNFTIPLSFFVLPGNFYQVTYSVSSPWRAGVSITRWVEWY